MDREDVRILGYCEECGVEITDELDEIFVDSDGNYFDSIDCLLEYLGVTRLEV